MINVPGYVIDDKIYMSLYYTFYKGKSIKNNRKVIVKILKEEYIKTNIYNDFVNEYNVLKKLEFIKGIVSCYDFVNSTKVKALILEELLGYNLLNRSFYEPDNIFDFINIAIKIVEVLTDIHKIEIIYRNVNPKNIIIYNDYNLKLIDFSKSIEYKNYYQKVSKRNLLNYNLEFISPEMTGYKYKLLDYRSDYYSIGILFYKLLSGKSVFDVSDENEYIDCHLSKKPDDLLLLNKNIPKSLSDIVMKLLEKEPEDRYQSGIGIIKDLEFLKENLYSNAKDNFVIGNNDIIQNFKIREKTFEKNNVNVLKDLEDSIKDIANGSYKMIILTGDEGVGKIELLDRVSKFISNKKAVKVSVSCDKNKKQYSYYPIINAINSFAKYILNSGKEEKYWKNIIKKGLGDNIYLLKKVFIEFKNVFSDDNVTAEESIDIKDKGYQFIYLTQNIIKYCSKREHPLIFVLENIEYMDKETMDILTSILQIQELKYFGIIATINSDLDKNKTIIEEIKALVNNNALTKIYIRNLLKKDLLKLFVDMFNCEEEKIYGLIDIIYKITMGKVVYVKYMVLYFIRKRLIYYDKKWNVMIDNICKILTFEKMEDLYKLVWSEFSNNERELIKILVCYSDNLINPYIIGKILGVGIKDLYEMLKNSIDFNILTVVEGKFKFYHRSIKSYLDSEILENEKIKIHGEIGKILIQYYKIKKSECFEVSMYLNYSVNILNDNEKIVLCELNYEAGRKSLEIASLENAFYYFEKSIKLLPDKCWENFYRLTYNLYVKYSMAACYIGDYKRAVEGGFLLINNSKSIIEKARAYLVLVDVYITKNQLGKVINLTYKILNLFGIYLIKNPKNYNIYFEMKKTMYIMNRVVSKKNINSLTNLKKCNDIYMNTCLEVIEKVEKYCLKFNYKIYLLIVLKRIQYTFKYGVFKESITSYLMYGSILSNIYNDIEYGYKVSKIGIVLLDKFNIRYYRIKARYLYNINIRHLKESINNVIEPLEYLFEASLEYGNLEYAFLTYRSFMYLSFLSGQNIQKTLMKGENNFKILNKIEMSSRLDECEYIKNEIYNIFVDKKSKLKLIDDEIVDNNFNKIFRDRIDLDIILTIYIFKVYNLILFNEYEKANIYINRIKDKLIYIKELYLYRFFIFIETIIDMNINYREGKKFKLRVKNKIIYNINLMEYWSENGSSNYKHKFYLMKAIYEKFNKNYLKSKKFFKIAIDEVKKSDILNEEALCYEEAAKFYLEEKFILIAEFYIKRAYSSYVKWGAVLKASFLKSEYIELFSKKKLFSNIKRDIVNITRKDNRSENIEKILKHSKDISSELEFSNFIKKMLYVSIRIVESQYGVFMIVENGVIKIKAIVKENEKVRFVKGKDLTDDNEEVSYNIVIRCYNSKEIIIANDIQNDTNYINDSYIKNTDIKSILVMPIVYENIVRGIIYFENYNLKKAFLEECISNLNYMLQQINISYENSLKFSKLENRSMELKNRIKDREYELSLANNKLKEAISELDSYIQKDSLTQMDKRNEFLLKINKEYKSFRENSDKLTVAICVIDNFNKISNLYGEEIENLIICEISKILKNNIRTKDVIARWSEKEFIIIMPNASLKSSNVFLERIQDIVISKNIYNNGNKIRMSITIGLSELNNNKNIVDCIEEADLLVGRGMKLSENSIYM